MVGVNEVGMIWAGAYNEKVKKYMYGYQISNKTTRPTLKLKHRMLMPNRTQGVTFTKTGKMIVSRSCQSAKNKSGFMSCVDTYKPTWNFGKSSLCHFCQNKQKKVLKNSLFHNSRPDHCQYIAHHNQILPHIEILQKDRLMMSDDCISHETLQNVYFSVFYFSDETYRRDFEL